MGKGPTAEKRSMFKIIDNYILKKFLGTFVFTMLVIMAVVSTVITTPALRYHMARGGIDRPALGTAAAVGTTATGS